MGKLKQDCDTNVTTAITYRTSDDYTDEQVLDLLVVKGKRPSELPLELGCDGTTAAQLVVRALDSTSLIDIMRNQKLSFLRLQKYQDDLANLINQQVLDGELDLRAGEAYRKSLTDSIDTINRTFSTQSDLFTKVTEAHSREFVKTVEQSAFILLDKWDGEIMDAAKAKEELIEMLGRC